MQTEHQPGSVTAWIHQLGGDDPQPAAVLWKRFEPQLLAFIVQRIRRGPLLLDGEDAVANAVYLSLLRLARKGKLSQTDRVGFWKLMKTIASRRIIDQQRNESRYKRGGGEVVSESVIRIHSAPPHAILDTFPSKSPPPDFLAMTSEFLEAVAALFNKELRLIFELRLEGLTVKQISEQIGKSTPTVERKLRIIRERLQSNFIGDGVGGIS